jgi:capsid protein
MLSRFAAAYDAIVDKDRRRPPKRRVKHEDDAVNQRDRHKLAGTSRDIARNFTIARWAIGKHLDYVSAFSFQAKTPSEALNAEIERFMAGWSSRQRCDIARRHPLRRLIRLAEACRCVSGDHAFLKIVGRQGANNRGKLQAIEGDRIAQTQDIPDTVGGPAAFRNGVRTAAGGASLDYHIAKRDENGRLAFGRVVPASNVFFHAFYDRFDQVRGISPIVSSLNTFQDVYEGFDYALAKIKVAQLFGLVTYRSSDDPLGSNSPSGGDIDGDGVDDDTAVDFGRGPFQLDLDVEDKAEFLDASTPANETAEFLQQMIAVAIKALDIPYSFYDESFTNFYGSRGGLIQYLKSCRNKIADLQELLNDITRWRLGLAVADGDIALPAGLDFADIAWDWVPDGVPWWDPVKEVSGNKMAIAAGLSDYQTVCRQAGTDFYDNVDRRAEQEAYAAQRGVKLDIGFAEPIEAAEGDDDA